ncbi:MAG: hypothetical protein EOP49_05040, partial [Sphingobacteriales bacterium]
MFNSPFYWDGTSNIVVSFCYSNSNASNSAATVKTDTYTGTNVAAYSYADNQSAAAVCATVTGSTGGSGGSSTSTTRARTIFNGVIATDITSTYTWEWNPGAISGDTITVNPLVTTTYEVTAFNPVTGCTSLPTQVEVTVLPLPATPTATPSTQCGEGIPTASVSGGTGTFLWYDAATGGNLVQTGGTTFAGSINTTTTWYVAEDDGTCESERAEVVATVNQPDAITATGPASICIGGDINLGVTQTGSNQTYTYTWTASPEAGSGITGSLSGGAQTITPTAAGTYTYNIAGFDAAGPCNVSDQITIVVNELPVITSATGTPEAICNGNQSVLTAESIPAPPSSFTLGTGSSATTSYQSPFYHLYGGLKDQFLIRASELTALGMTAGQITGLGLDFTSGGATYNSFSLAIAPTALTALSSSGLVNTGFTTVYSASSFTTPSATGMSVIDFNTPFIWDGTSNIVIQFCWSNNNGGGTSSHVRYTSGLAYTAHAYYRADNQSPATLCGQTSVTSTSTGRPNFMFVDGGLNLTSSLNWAWNPGGLTGSTVNVTPSVTTTYTVIATDPVTGCSSLPSTVEIEVLPLAANATASSMTTCAGDAVTLNANATGGEPLSYSWSDGTSVVNNTASFVVNPTTTTTYTVTVQDVCLNSVQSSVTVTVNPLPSASIAETGPINLCSPATQVITAVTDVANPEYQWLLNGTEIPAATSATYTVTESGMYSVRITNGDTDCPATSSTIEVNINPLPSAIVMDPVAPEICEGTGVALHAASLGSPTTGVIGTGTVSNSSTSATSPYKGWYGGHKVQF